MKSSSLQ
jgi:hypothetical protein